MLVYHVLEKQAGDVGVEALVPVSELVAEGQIFLIFWILKGTWLNSGTEEKDPIIYLSRRLSSKCHRICWEWSWTYRICQPAEETFWENSTSRLLTLRNAWLLQIVRYGLRYSASSNKYPGCTLGQRWCQQSLLGNPPLLDGGVLHTCVQHHGATIQEAWWRWKAINLLESFMLDLVGIVVDYKVLGRHILFVLQWQELLFIFLMSSKSSHIMFLHIHVWTLGIVSSCHSSVHLRAVPGLPLGKSCVSHLVHCVHSHGVRGQWRVYDAVVHIFKHHRLCILKDLLSVSSVGPKLRSVVCCYSLSNLSMVNIFLMTMITAIKAGQKRRLGRTSVKYSAGTKRNKESIAMDKATAVGRAR